MADRAAKGGRPGSGQPVAGGLVAVASSPRGSGGTGPSATIAPRSRADVAVTLEVHVRVREGGLGLSRTSRRPLLHTPIRRRGGQFVLAA